MARKHKVPVLRRQEAMSLATIVATQGWKRHAARGGAGVEFWSKKLPDGELQLVESGSVLGGYDIQYVGKDDAVKRLGRTRAALATAQVNAVLTAVKANIQVVDREDLIRTNPDGWIGQALRHPGRMSALADELELPSQPFMARPLNEQKTVLFLCVRRHGYRSCRASVTLLGNLPAIRRDPRKAKRVATLVRYVQRLDRTPRTNPGDGSWSALPTILGHYQVGGARLTARQVAEITREA